MPSVAAARGQRGGFSLLEVMIATFVLVVGLMAVLGQYAVLANTRTLSVEQANAQRILRNLSERVTATDWWDFNTAAAPWSYARYDPRIPFKTTFYNGQISTNGIGPITGLPPMKEVDLENFGVVTAPTTIPGQQVTGIRNVWVYFEYWRAITATNNLTSTPYADKPGLLSPPVVINGTTNLFNQAFFNNLVATPNISLWWNSTAANQPLSDCSLALYPTHNLTDKLSDTSDDDLTDPVLIRIAVYFGDPDTNATVLGRGKQNLVKFILKKG
jgi:prepilin-type N-terminal cleavage/methylation domain-containing protein